MLLLDEERKALKDEKEILRDFINDEDEDSVVTEDEGTTSGTAKREERSASNSRSRSSSTSDHGNSIATHEISLPLSLS